MTEESRLQSPPAQALKPSCHQPSQHETGTPHSAAEAVSADSWLAFRTKAGSRSFGLDLAHCSICVFYCMSSKYFSSFGSFTVSCSRKVLAQRGIHCQKYNKLADKNGGVNAEKKRKNQGKQNRALRPRPSPPCLEVVDAKTVRMCWCCYAYW